MSLVSGKQKSIILFSPTLIHSIFAFTILCSYYFCDQALQKQVNTERIIATSTTLSKLFYDSGLCIGAYSLTKNQNFIDRYQKLVNQISPTLNTLHKLVDQQPVKEVSFQDIDQLAQQAIKQLESAKMAFDPASALPLDDTQGDIRNMYKQAKSLADQLQYKLDLLSQAEQSFSKNSSNERSICQLLLCLIFFCYLGFNLAMQKRFIKILVNTKQSATQIE